VNDLFDTVTGGNASPGPEPAAPGPAVEEKNQVLAEEGAAAEPEELTGTETEDEATEEIDEESAEEEGGENAAGNETPDALQVPLPPQPRSRRRKSRSTWLKRMCTNSASV